MRARFKFSRPVAAALGLAALAGVTTANAADVIMEEPPAPAAPMEEPPLATWAGPYAGVTLGYGFSGNTDVSGLEIETDGVLGSAFIGSNYQFGNIVAGVEADIGYSDVNGSNGGFESQSGVEGSLRARLGYVVTPDILLYATAGGAAQDLEVSSAAGSDSNTMLGWTAGGGADVKVTENVFVRGEYRYTDFGSDDFNVGGVTHEVDSTDHRVQLGVGLKF